MSDTNRGLISVGLVGNPNCGKTTLLNSLTQSKESVGNYPRVTVKVATRQVDHRGYTIKLDDLPGIYALTSQTPEERETRDYIHAQKVDIIINVLDAGNLPRSLYLTSQLIEMGRPVLFVLNMADEAARKGLLFHEDTLASMLGGPVIQTVARTGEGLALLLDKIVEMVSRVPPKPIFLTYDRHLEQAVARVTQYVRELHPDNLNDHQCRWLAIKLLEGDDLMLRRENEHTHLAEMVRRESYDISRDHGQECEFLFANARYGFVHGMLVEAVHVPENLADRQDLTRQLDHLFLHQVWGMPLFVGFLWLMFQATFTLGVYPTGWINAGVAGIAAFLDGHIPAGMTHDLVVHGIVAGVGGTIVFLPNIVILFFFMALFSETGYLARAAFLMDRLMHFFGLHGKALIPLVIGFGCNVPGIMATRTIEDNRSRLITILITPFMLCAARLPVFILFAGAFFSQMAGTMVFIMYILSILIAMGATIVLNRLFIREEDEAFVMELPPYRMPTVRAVLIHMGDNALGFLQKIAGVILVGSIVIWFLHEYPHDPVLSQDYAATLGQLRAEPATPERHQHILTLERARSQETLEKSYLGQIALRVAPLFAPLHLSWQDTVAILTGLVAKEVVVASYSVLYAQGADSTEESASLRTSLASAMAPHVAFAFMLFVLLYAPCLATMATIRREAGSWKWVGYSVIFSFTLAYGLAFVVVTLGGFFV